MQKYKVWLLILFGLGVLIPVLFFTPVAAVRDNSGQYSKKTKHPTAYIRKTDTPTPESNRNHGCVGPGGKEEKSEYVCGSTGAKE
jgi:hypothetical protein